MVSLAGLSHLYNTTRAFQQLLYMVLLYKHNNLRHNILHQLFCTCAQVFFQSEKEPLLYFPDYPFDSLLLRFNRDASNRFQGFGKDEPKLQKRRVQKTSGQKDSANSGNTFYTATIPSGSLV
jgi:hypothetical protein